jgi:hypothetical protein
MEKKTAYISVPIRFLGGWHASSRTFFGSAEIEMCMSYIRHSNNSDVESSLSANRVVVISLHFTVCVYTSYLKLQQKCDANKGNV